MIGARRRWLGLLAVAVAAVAAVGGLLAVRALRAQAPLHHLVSSQDYLPGRRANVFAPASVKPSATVVVLIPGGGWTSAYDVGLRPLADKLAGSGKLAVTITYRTASTSSFFPAPAEDVACAVSFAAQHARQLGVRQPRVVLAGHSAGAQLAAIVALRNADFQHSCPYAVTAPSALIGLSGPYDLYSAQQLAYPLFNAFPSSAPRRWREADPLLAAHGALRPQPLPVLLLHGLADDGVPPSQTTTFAVALRRAGHPVSMQLLPGIGHQDVYSPAVAAPPILRWLARLPAPQPTP